MYNKKKGQKKCFSHSRQNEILNQAARNVFEEQNGKMIHNPKHQTNKKKKAKRVFIEESWVLKFHRTFLGPKKRMQFWKSKKKIRTNFVEIEKLLIGLSLKYFSMDVQSDLSVSTYEWRTRFACVCGLVSDKMHKHIPSICIFWNFLQRTIVACSIAVSRRKAKSCRNP